VTVPKVGDTFEKVSPTLSSLQPFTPCLVGFLSTWGSAAAYSDANGQYVRIPVRVGPESVLDTPANPGDAYAKPVPRTCDAVAQGGAGNAGSTANPVSAGIGGLN
jgi:phospholipid/cholesterol/gamma-HCH transport system substrate-binding protein